MHSRCLKAIVPECFSLRNGDQCEQDLNHLHDTATVFDNHAPLNPFQEKLFFLKQLVVRLLLTLVVIADFYDDDYFKQEAYRKFMVPCYLILRYFSVAFPYELSCGTLFSL